jgi:hypothetical protein
MKAKITLNPESGKALWWSGGFDYSIDNPVITEDPERIEFAKNDSFLTVEEVKVSIKKEG